MNEAITRVRFFKRSSFMAATLFYGILSSSVDEKHKYKVQT